MYASLPATPPDPLTPLPHRLTPTTVDVNPTQPQMIDPKNLGDWTVTRHFSCTNKLEERCQIRTWHGLLKERASEDKSDSIDYRDLAQTTVAVVIRTHT